MCGSPGWDTITTRRCASGRRAPCRSTSLRWKGRSMSVVIETVPANVGHVCELAVTMRDADRREVEALGYSPFDAAFRSLVLSGGEAWTLLANGKVVAIG